MAASFLLNSEASRTLDSIPRDGRTSLAFLHLSVNVPVPREPASSTLLSKAFMALMGTADAT